MGLYHPECHDSIHEALCIDRVRLNDTIVILGGVLGDKRDNDIEHALLNDG